MRRLLPWHNSSRFGTCSWNLSVSRVFVILLGVYWSVRLLHADRSHDQMTTGFSFRSEQNRACQLVKTFDWPSRKHKHASWISLLLTQHKQLWANIFICQSVFNTLLCNIFIMERHRTSFPEYWKWAIRQDVCSVHLSFLLIYQSI